MKLICDRPRVSMDITTGDVELMLRVAPESKGQLERIVKIEGNMTVEIKKHRPLRSLNANAYLWILCDKISAEIGSTKELVYREIIHRVGKFDIVAVQNDRADEIIHGWACRGIGWIAERMGGCKIDGCERLMLYYGSSSYDTAEMSRVIDETVSEAKELGIDTLTPDEIERMKGLWSNDE